MWDFVKYKPKKDNVALSTSAQSTQLKRHNRIVTHILLVFLSDAAPGCLSSCTDEDSDIYQAGALF